MTKIQYKLTTRLIKDLSEVERIYGQLEGMRIPASLELNLERDNLVQSSYSSNSIEGNPLSKVEVTNLILSSRIPVNRDEKEVQNYFEILKNLDSKITDKFDTSFILSTHKKLMTGVKDDIKGEFRNEKVVIGYKDEIKGVVVKHDPPFHNSQKIKKAVEELSSWVDASQEVPILRAGIFHHEFVYIHPFVDGNGRVCRLSTAFLLLKDNYLINKYFVLDDYYDIDREQYSDKLHSADKGDKTEWLEYFVEGVKYSLQSAHVKIQNGLEKTKVSRRLTKKEKELFEIVKEYKEVVSSDISKRLKISRQQAHNLLRSLVEKGYLKKLGTTKGSYYKIR